MLEQPGSRRAPARVVTLVLVLVATYIYQFIWQGGVRSNLAGLLFDLLLFSLCFQAFLFFYAQFVVPLRDLKDRSQMGPRLLLHARGTHGAVIFVRNGRLVERADERQRTGPALLWVDTASAVVTRSDAGAFQAMGPGVHLVNRAETIAGVFDLHVQRCSVGPNADDDLFSRLEEGADEQARRRYADQQSRRMSVSGRTRDGHEVVPQIRVVFKMEGSPSAPGAAGSHFGFNKDAVERAVRAEGINPAANLDQSSHVAWNQLPGLIAVDLWREYLGKFTLDELFDAKFAPLPDILQPEEPPAAGAVAEEPRATSASFVTTLVARLNDAWERSLNSRGMREGGTGRLQSAERATGIRRSAPTGARTALQIIVDMMRERMMKAAVPMMDDCGRTLNGHAASDEFRKLKERGLVVLDVGIDTFRLEPALEDQLVVQWNTGWTSNASVERGQVEQLELLATQAGRRRALLELTGALAEAIRKEAPDTTASAVGALLRAAQGQIQSDEELFRKASNDFDSLGKLLSWAESENAS